MQTQPVASHAVACKAQETVTKLEYVEAFRGLLERDTISGRCREIEGLSENSAMHDVPTPTKAAHRCAPLQFAQYPKIMRDFFKGMCRPVFGSSLALWSCAKLRKLPMHVCELNQYLFDSRWRLSRCLKACTCAGVRLLPVGHREWRQLVRNALDVIASSNVSLIIMLR